MKLRRKENAVVPPVRWRLPPILITVSRQFNYSITKTVIKCQSYLLYQIKHMQYYLHLLGRCVQYTQKTWDCWHHTLNKQRHTVLPRVGVAPICCVHQCHAGWDTFPDHRLVLHLQCIVDGLPVLTIVCPADTIKTKKMQKKISHPRWKVLNQNLHTDLTLPEFFFL